MSLFLTIELCAIIIPVIFSFDKNLQFRKNWKSVLAAFPITASVYIITDIYFTAHGIWGFDPRYHSGILFFGLPLEEWLFFIAIPYASIFIHYSIEFVRPKIILNDAPVRIISAIIIAGSALVIMFNYDKIYTVFNFAMVIVALLLSCYDKERVINRFYITFLVILVPFFITNSILTGTFIDGEVYWYDTNEIMNIRIFTMPVEDIWYAFSLIYINLFLMSKFQVLFGCRSNLPES